MRVSFVAIALLILLIFTPVEVQAGSFSAGTAEELIAAIHDANDEIYYPGEDTITLTADITLTEIDNDSIEDGANGLPIITSRIILRGSDFSLQRDENAPEFRLLLVDPSGTLIISQLTVQNGKSAKSGGAIFNRGWLALNSSTILGNFTQEDGGGVYNSGNMAVTASTFNTNYATGGGGIANLAGGELGIGYSTFMNNVADMGGGIANAFDSKVEIFGSVFYQNDAFSLGSALLNSATAWVANTTISGNLPAIRGGGIYNSGWLNLNYMTIWNNSATETDGGGGIYAEFISEELKGFTTVQHSIIGNNVNGDCLKEGSTYVVSNNLATGECGDTPVTNLDISLIDNGGLTLTHALLPASNAIDGSDDCHFMLVDGVDQRNYERDIQCDIGAYEFIGVNTTATPSPTPIVTPTATATLPPTTELLVMGDFETANAGVPIYWTGKNLSDDRLKCNKDSKPPVAYNGYCAMQFKGSSGENAKLQQVIDVDDFTFNADELLTLSLFSRTKGAAPTTRAKFTITYSDNSLEQSKVSVIILPTAEYVQFSGSKTLLSGDIAKIKVQITNKSTSGRVWVDDISLQKNNSATLLSLP